MNKLVHVFVLLRLSFLITLTWAYIEQAAAHLITKLLHISVKNDNILFKFYTL